MRFDQTRTMTCAGPLGGRARETEPTSRGRHRGSGGPGGGNPGRQRSRCGSTILQHRNDDVSGRVGDALRERVCMDQAVARLQRERTLLGRGGRTRCRGPANNGPAGVADEGVPAPRHRWRVGLLHSVQGRVHVELPELPMQHGWCVQCNGRHQRRAWSRTSDRSHRRERPGEIAALRSSCLCSADVMGGPMAERIGVEYTARERRSSLKRSSWRAFSRTCWPW